MQLVHFQEGLLLANVNFDVVSATVDIGKSEGFYVIVKALNVGGGLDITKSKVGIGLYANSISGGVGMR